MFKKTKLQLRWVRDIIQKAIDEYPTAQLAPMTGWENPNGENTCNQLGTEKPLNLRL